MNLVDWFLVFLTLFWLRETTNVVTGLIKAIAKGSFLSFLEEIVMSYDLPEV